MTAAPNSNARKVQQAQQKLRSGDLDGAAALCRAVLARAPGHAEASWLLGTVSLMGGDARSALPLLERAVEAAPGNGSALEHLGVARLMLGEHAAAEQALRKALAITGAPPSVRMRLGLALLHQGRNSAAVDELRRALAADAHDVDARLNLGRAYAAQGLWADAAEAFEQVIARDSGHLDALFNLGVACIERRDYARARACFERILARDSAYADARERLAAVYMALGRYREAIAQLDTLLQARPRDSALHVVLANARVQLGALDDAYAAAQAAVRLDPRSADAYGVMSLIHYVRGELPQAVEALETGYDATGAPPLLGSLVNLLHRLCEWDRWQRAWQRLAPLVDTASDIGSPFWLLCEDTSARQQLEYARRWAGVRFGERAPMAQPPRGDKAGARRLRVGYFSSDFQEHAVAHLAVEVLELHDRERFEIFAYSYGPDDGSALRARLRAGIEHFVDVAWDPDDAIAERIRGDALDVLVDMKGYTAGERLGVMARRPCAVQATWLGYPGTTGASFIDYVIVDPFIVPPDAETAYSERVLRMPASYQANDRKRVHAQPLARSDYGLSDEAFVFCCFNQSVKIVPEVFARWMKLLERVPGSILWLLEDNRWASENLKRSAAAAGVDPARVVMARRLPHAEHLARFAAADLALDTFPYTSHTTASDALWLGCPLVALCGETFAARVSGSLLSSCGLAELVTYSLDDYEQLACRLANDRAYLADVRARLASARDDAPLFDSARFARDLEALYVQIARAPAQ